MKILWKRTTPAEFWANHVSTQFPLYKIGWNFGILRSGSVACIKIWQNLSSNFDVVFDSFEQFLYSEINDFFSKCEQIRW